MGIRVASYYDATGVLVGVGLGEAVTSPVGTLVRIGVNEAEVSPVGTEVGTGFGDASGI